MQLVARTTTTTGRRWPLSCARSVNVWYKRRNRRESSRQRNDTKSLSGDEPSCQPIWDQIERIIEESVQSDPKSVDSDLCHVLTSGLPEHTSHAHGILSPTQTVTLL